MHSQATRGAIEAVWHIESPRLLGALIRLVGDLDVAEDLLQEALVQALEKWPVTGIPANPGAWLMTVARHRGVDGQRRQRTRHLKQDLLTPPSMPPQPDHALDAPIPDDLLRLLFVACHPILSAEARVALTLRLLGGLSTDALARAFLVPEPTMAQRIVRAKRTLSAARVPFEVPRGLELVERLPSVLEVIYLIFNEGYAASRGDHWLRPALCEDALRLGRILAELVPDQAEAHGLVALLELQASRFKARVGPDGAPILLLDQDRARWDPLLIRRGLTALARAEALAGPSGPYTLQAGIAACHARARHPDDTDWPHIVALYDALLALTESPVVALNRAVAVGMAYGPQEALPLVQSLAQVPALQAYHLLPAVEGDLLLKLGRLEEARQALERAAGMTGNIRERQLLLERAATCR